jgi:hypothetical protein
MRIRCRVALLLGLVAAAVLLSPRASAQEGDTLITDPALLVRLGLPPDARNVNLAKGAVLDQKSSPAEPEEFGTTDFGWTTVVGSEHITHADVDIVMDATLSIFIGSTPISRSVFAQLQMPTGTLFRQVTWFVQDISDSADFSGSVIRVCQTGLPLGEPVVTVLGSGGSSGSSGEFFFTVFMPAGEVVRNLSCVYAARTQFDEIGAELRLRKVRAGWQRQVSPAPAVATFPNDTPTSHPYFQFVEALAAAGITGGCAPQAFCPNAAVTRGQMAVFLSVALGLHFAN